jgi:uncharacterized protein (TIGR02594 family)
MNRIDEMHDIPKVNLEEKIGDFEFEGAVVSVIPQPDGRFTIRAAFLSNTAALGVVPTARSSTDIDSTPWLTVAKRELSLDVEEIKGSQDNPRIVAYHDTTTLSANDDETPWCSSFVNFCMKEAGINGTHSALARSWEKWGKKLDQPATGCVVVLERPAGGANAGHVGFYLAEQGSEIQLLGGNQGDKVCIKPFKKNRVIAYRWPG